MYIPTFRQTQRINTGKVAEQCAVTREVSGESRLYAVGMTTGAAGRWTDTATHKPAPFITITDAKITELTLRETEDSYFVTTVIDKFSD